jgi:hypothetical protein
MRLPARFLLYHFPQAATSKPEVCNEKEKSPDVPYFVGYPPADVHLQRLDLGSNP